MTVNEKINAVRTRLDLSQAEFGKRVGVSRKTISHYEQTGASVPYQMQIKICEVFHLAKEEIFDDSVVGNLTNNQDIIDRIKSDFEKLDVDSKLEVMRLILSKQ